MVLLILAELGGGGAGQNNLGAGYAGSDEGGNGGASPRDGIGAGNPGGSNGTGGMLTLYAQKFNNVGNINSIGSKRKL